MKTTVLIAAALTVSACTTTPQKQTMEQVEISSMQSHSFCGGDKLKSYIETDYYYQFTCSDGRYFMLPKKR